MHHSTTQTVTFSNIDKKPIQVHFSQPQSSSDGGALLLKAADEAMGLTKILAEKIRDTRQPSKVTHSTLQLVQQRVFGLACGYADNNDAKRLSQDPIQKLLVGHDPSSEEGLGSQPTLSRFENSIDRPDLLRMGIHLAQQIIRQQKKRLHGKVRKITIDIDGTEDPVHGQQEGSCFSGFYDSHCYQPLVAFLTFNEETEQYLVAALLRSGTAGSQGTDYLLKKLIPLLSEWFPKAKILVRLDGGFAHPGLLDQLDTWAALWDLHYVVGMAGNSRLRESSQDDMDRAMELCLRHHDTSTLYGETRYQAKSWAEPRRVIYKAEVVWASGKLPRENDRYVITNRQGSPESLYGLYRQRGDNENRIKELKEGLEMDRTSCQYWPANQFRLLLTTAAMALWQWIRSLAKGTEAASWQVSTLRERLIKIGASVKSSVRRLQFLLPVHYPWQELWCTLMQRLQPLSS